MGDKYDGAIAGGGRQLSDPMSISSALQSLSLNESLMVLDDAGDMKLLRAILNPFHGGLMLAEEPDHTAPSAMIQAIKLSQMTSMLADNSRCSKYAKAIEYAMNKAPASRVLDIGTGTGLLAMIAARSGASHVDAVEMFQPLAHLASQIIAANKLDEYITVHPVKSTSLSLKAEGAPSPEMAMDRRADILVTEIFDSMMLGEACLPVIADAHTRLLRDDAVVIPAKASLYGIVCSSELFRDFHDLGANFPFYRSECAESCTGGVRGMPIHMDSLTKEKDYVFVTDKFLVFDLDFSSAGIEESMNSIIHRTIPRTRGGVPNAVITWWELDLLGNGQIIYSTEPGVENWQDHWLPVCYPLPSRNSEVTWGVESPITLSMGHDEMSVWFALGDKISRPPTCRCGFHVLAGGAQRIYELGNSNRLESISLRIRNAINTSPIFNDTSFTGPIRCIDVSDGSLCSLLAASSLAGKDLDIVSIEEDSEISAFLYGQITRKLGKEDTIRIVNEPLSALVERETALDETSRQCYHVLLSEPYTRATAGYPLATLANLIVQRNALSDLLAEEFVIVPRIARIMAQVVQFPADTLQNSFDRIDTVEGLDHSCFAELYTDTEPDTRLPMPLWQYNAKEISEKTCLQTVDLHTIADIMNPTETSIKIEPRVSAEAVAIWVEYDGEDERHLRRCVEVIYLQAETKRAIELSGSIVLDCVFSNTATWVVSAQAGEE